MQNKNFERLSEGFKALHLPVNEESLEKMDKFLQLLLKWNKVYNLTSINNETEAIDKHLLDSATLIPLLKEFEQPNGKTSVMDVGCGGGLPGIPAAILLPNFRFTLVDTVAKKIAFVSQAIINLKLLNAQAVNARVESYCPEEKFDLITSRAFSSISTFINLTEKHLSENGRWIIMKGKLPEDEIEEIPDFVKIVEIRKVEIPNVDSERHLVVLSRK